MFAVLSATINATAGKSLRLPLVDVLSVSLYQLVPCTRLLQAPPSESSLVSYKNIASSAVVIDVSIAPSATSPVTSTPLAVVSSFFALS